MNPKGRRFLTPGTAGPRVGEENDEVENLAARSGRIGSAVRNVARTRARSAADARAGCNADAIPGGDAHPGTGADSAARATAGRRALPGQTAGPELHQRPAGPSKHFQ